MQVTATVQHSSPLVDPKRQSAFHAQGAMQQVHTLSDIRSRRSCEVYPTNSMPSHPAICAMVCKVPGCGEAWWGGHTACGAGTVEAGTKSRSWGKSKNRMSSKVTSAPTGGDFWDLSGPAVDTGPHRKRAWACVCMNGWVGMYAPDTGLCGAARCKQYDVESLIAVE
jgi:hypothetical protein